MTSKKLIHEMLTENTGTHMMDSGGGSGRNWQENRGKTLQDFENEPEVVSDDEGWTISLFHYLTGQLELDTPCDEFNSKSNDDWDSDIYGVSIKGSEWLSENEFEIKDSFNSYNGDSSLSQVIQGTYLESVGEGYILLQIHGGADVRGGYTDAKLFKISNNYGEFLAPEDVYGTITQKNGEKIDVDNAYDGCNLTTEAGEVVERTDGEKIELSLGV